MIQSVVVISVEEKDFAEIDVAAHIKLFFSPCNAVVVRLHESLCAVKTLIGGV